VIEPTTPAAAPRPLVIPDANFMLWLITVLDTELPLVFDYEPIDVGIAPDQPP
jgi:hypothetical protein